MDNPIVRKGRNGWEAENRFEFDGDYKLTIETHKDSSGPSSRLVSRASVSQHKDGMMSHAFGLGSGGDYSERLIVSAARCTEKSVAGQHAKALEMLADVQAKAKAHYMKFPVQAYRK